MTQIAKASETTYKQLALFELEKLEKKILDGERKAREGFIEIGLALDEIISRRGYLQRGFKNPEEYCEKQFGFSLRHGQRYIAAAKASKQIEKITGEAPRNEAAARVLTGIASDEKTVKRVEAELKKSKTSLGKATAEKIQEVVDRVRGKGAAPKPKPADEAAEEESIEEADEGTPAQSFAPPVYVASISLEPLDQCPHCHTVPQSYRLDGEMWICGTCEKTVLLKVAVMVESKHCPICQTIVSASDDFCGNCGEAL